MILYSITLQTENYDTSWETINSDYFTLVTQGRTDDHTTNFVNVRKLVI